MTHPNRLKVLLLGASFNTRNMGVSALTAGAIKCVKRRYPESDICFLDYGKNAETYNFKVFGRDILIQLVNLRFSKKIYLKNHIAYLLLLSVIARLIPFKEARNRLISSNRRLRQICDSDIIASISGGDSLSDIYGLNRFFYVALPQILVILLGKRLILLPQTIGPFKRKLTRAVAGYIIGKAEIVYSRDYSGLLEARQILGMRGRPDKLRFCYDVGFVIDPIRPARLDLDGLPEAGPGRPCTAGVNISGLLSIGGYSEDNMFGLKDDYRELITDVIDLLINEKGANVLLIPHVFGAKSHAESDAAACEEVYGELKGKYGNRIFIVRGSYDQNEIKHIIGLCDFFVGSRMHACIAALSQNVPSVAIAYSKKFYGVMESIGVESCVADPCRLGKKEILGLVSRAFGERDLIKERLMNIIPQVKESVLGLFDDILPEGAIAKGRP